MFCRKCGAKLKDGQVFCHVCGNKIEMTSQQLSSESKDEHEIENLVIRFKSGDETAYQELYNRTYQRNRYVALKIVHSESEADDVLQDAYLKVYTKINQYVYTGESSFASWTSKIVNNTAINHLRGKQPMLFSEMETDDGEEFQLELEDNNVELQPEFSYDKKETANLVREIVDTLPDDQRASVMMFYFEEMSVKDIAAECECSENTVKSRLNYARKSMLTRADALKKRGLLSGAITMAGLIALLRSKEAFAAEATKHSATTLANVLSEVHSGVSGSAGVGTGTASAGTGIEAGAGGASAAGTTAGAVGAALGLKIAVGVLSVVLVAVLGGGAVLVVNHISNQSKISESIDTDSGSDENSATSGSASDISGEEKAEEETQRDPFEEFISSNTFLCDLGEEYIIKAKIVEDEWGYSVENPLDMTKPKELKDNYLGYRIDDFDLDGDKELLVIGTKWEEKGGEMYSLYKQPYSSAGLKLEMYENNAGKAELSSVYDDFGDLRFSAGIESWGGGFKCFTYKYNDKMIIAAEEDGSDYSAMFSDGWGNWWFAALTYENNEFKPIKGSFVDIRYSGGDESFQCNDEEWIELGQSVKYKIKELKTVGIDYRFGEYFDYNNTDPSYSPSYTMPSDKVKNAITVLETVNDTSKSSTHNPSDKEKSAKEATVTAVRFSSDIGNNDETGINDEDERKTFTLDDCMLDLGKQFSEVKDKFGWDIQSGQFINNGRFEFIAPETQLFYILNAPSNGDAYWEVTDETPVTEISASIGELIPDLSNDTMSIDEFKKFLKDNGCSSVKSGVNLSPGTAYYVSGPDEYYAWFDFDYMDTSYSIDINLGDKETNKIESSSYSKIVVERHHS